MRMVRAGLASVVTDAHGRREPSGRELSWWRTVGVAALATTSCQQAAVTDVCLNHLMEHGVCLDAAHSASDASTEIACPDSPPQIGAQCTLPAAMLCEYGGPCTGYEQYACDNGSWSESIADTTGCGPNGLPLGIAVADAGTGEPPDTSDDRTASDPADDGAAGDATDED